jgi:hypothetical protein
MLHSQGERGLEDNLIAVEMKKVESPLAERRADRVRLKAMTMPLSSVFGWEGSNPANICGYGLGAFQLIDRFQRRCSIEYYRGGELVGRRRVKSGAIAVPV